MHPGYLSNAYLVADEEGGTAVYVDSGAPLEPLLEAVERWRVTPVARAPHARARRPRRARGRARAAGRHRRLRDRRPAGRGAADARATATTASSFVVNGEACFSGDTLFKDAVGGTRDDFDEVKHSVMDVLMALPPETRVLPGHTDETTIGREWEENPFVRVWRGVDPEGTEPVRVGGEEATLVVWSPDYDGKGKAWVRFADGRDAIVGGSRVERG